MRKLKRAFEAVVWLIVITVLRVIAFFLRIAGFCAGRYRGLWLVSERGNEARDNGIVFFEYLNRVHPEINSVYIISPDAPARDMARAASAGRTLPKRGIRYLLSLVSAEALISTHDMGFTPDMALFHHFEKFPLFRGKRVFLQHGIIKDDIPWLDYSSFRTDIFVCSAKAERDYIMEAMHQKPETLRLIGLCRYDRLPIDPSPADEILIMPTWREPLSGVSDECFRASGYYKTWQAFISDERFNEYLARRGLHALFYPHAEFQRYLGLFSPGARVALAAKADYDVQELLIRCRALVTDYSSCFFDVSYMGKPVVFYQFDSEYFYREHYRRGYLDFEAFGAVAATAGEALEALEAGRPPDADSFFAYRDHLNCERTYDAIINIL